MKIAMKLWRTKSKGMEQYDWIAKNFPLAKQEVLLPYPRVDIPQNIVMYGSRGGGSGSSNRIKVFPFGCRVPLDSGTLGYWGERNVGCNYGLPRSHAILNAIQGLEGGSMAIGVQADMCPPQGFSLWLETLLFAMFTHRHRGDFASHYSEWEQHYRSIRESHLRDLEESDESERSLKATLLPVLDMSFDADDPPRTRTRGGS